MKINTDGEVDTGTIAAAIAPLTVACKANGISRTTAFRLSREKLLETFLIGKRRYVVLDSFARLAKQLCNEQNGSET